jgi:hypothetical protein
VPGATASPPSVSADSAEASAMCISAACQQVVTVPGSLNALALASHTCPAPCAVLAAGDCWQTAGGCAGLRLLIAGPRLLLFVDRRVPLSADICPSVWQRWQDLHQHLRGHHVRQGTGGEYWSLRHRSS